MWYLGGPVGLGHPAGGRDGVCEDLSVVRDPGTADALCCLRVGLLTYSGYISLKPLFCQLAAL